MICVTHLYELSRGFYQKKRKDVFFLRAERNTDEFALSNSRKPSRCRPALARQKIPSNAAFPNFQTGS
jgi:hypothetical protein